MKKDCGFFQKIWIDNKKGWSQAREIEQQEKNLFQKAWLVCFFFLWIVHLGLLNPTISWYYSKGQKTLEKGLNLLGIYSRELDRR